MSHNTSRSRYLVTPTKGDREGRILEDVPTRRMLAEAAPIKALLDPYVPPWCLDHVWLAGRDERDAWAIVDAHPEWQFLDIVHFFPSIPHQRLWRVLNRLDPTTSLTSTVNAYLVRLGIDVDPWNNWSRQRTDKVGIPEGCPFSPTLANLLLSDIDQRWQGRMIRLGDNFACEDRDCLRQQLLALGLMSHRTDTFARSRPRPAKRRPTEVR